MMDEAKAREKKEKLIHYLEGLDALLVAFSGGVDSTFLLAVAGEVLGSRVVAGTASSATYPSREQDEAIQFCKERGIDHVLFQSDEADLPAFLSNSPDRCYHCKKNLSEELLEVAKERGIKHIAYGANLDDLGDYRPGLQAAEEMGVGAPLKDAQLTKDEIRFLSKEMGLATWDKPAMACLASRVPYGEPITEKKLNMVEEAEMFLADCGFRQSRVRHHGAVARIEVETSEIDRVVQPETKAKIVKKFREIGFLHIALDLEGYVTGSLNRALDG